MEGKLKNEIRERRLQGRKSFAVLLDPDKVGDEAACLRLLDMCVANDVDFLLVGGSLITSDGLGGLIRLIKQHCDLPVILFPGSNLHIDGAADAILFLSLISGRNPDFLIGQHVISAPILRRSKLEILSTGYLLVGAGNETTVSYISNTMPIPSEKADVAACTAMAGEMLGLGMVYLDAGSGAQHPVPPRMIGLVRKSIDIPLIVGGGLDTPNKAAMALEAGADIIVVGNGIEKNPDLLTGVSQKIKALNEAVLKHS